MSNNEQRSRWKTCEITLETGLFEEEKHVDGKRESGVKINGSSCKSKFERQKQTLVSSVAIAAASVPK